MKTPLSDFLRRIKEGHSMASPQTWFEVVSKVIISADDKQTEVLLMRQIQWHFKAALQLVEVQNDCLPLLTAHDA